jgi:uncharacterized protein YggE
MHKECDANFNDTGKRWDRVRAALKLGDRQGRAPLKLDDTEKASEEARKKAREKARERARWVRSLTYGNLLLGSGGLLLGDVVARLLLG